MNDASTDRGAGAPDALTESSRLAERPTTMRRLRYRGEGRVEIEHVPLPVRAPGELLVRIEASAVCGSERHDLLTGVDGNFGHEAAGVVAEADPDSPVAVGTRVGLYAVKGCSECGHCLRGRETMCERTPEILSGWHAEYAVVPVRCARPLADDIDAGVGAMMTGDPLGVPVRAARRAPSPDGGDVVVVGLGPVGLAHVLVRAFRGARVIGVEPSPFRRQLALALGAQEVYAPGERDLSAALVIECTGIAPVIEQSLALVENGGVFLQSGECGDPVTLVPSEVLIHREVELKGSWYYASEDYGTMNELVADGLPLGQLATHDVRAEDAQEAVTAFLEGATGKVLVRW
ncbi:zinc-dependent alcohol dehydrogenase [Microbacterium saperdae]|uniref:(R,R)-butanediol dehydrogenase/meso-butanediol dehydrogenase/diacetyl reductase n=1 Tax=Microbacterium saperdae TaxID=69368 RepID=A0A543BIT3_9MICO|nr:zinc-binding dehydrogenase [Microbacterium saperdae]TQL84698.1 (R,R)-butanediol dehydrogenase/meso-butanediol dehydrogenase/diacetyl reductase [Microbacterium saperdae]GGM64886.1 oxidoreductase [Microbacterium saperdae]